MKYTFTGKNIEITDAIKEKAISKIDRISKLLPENTEVFVTLDVMKSTQKLEVTIPLKKRILRAEVTGSDFYVSIDEVVDILERQMIKYKSRLRDKSRRDVNFKDEYTVHFGDVEKGSEQESDHKKIERVKSFALKPMDAEEAVMEMELSDHNFYVFRNGETDEVNVVYKRKNNSYGLIEPEC